MWNGYTWIDQTTYLETAGRDALDQMLYLEAERMTNGLYDAGRHRIRTDGDHLRAAGRRERPRAAARHRGDRDRVPLASLPASDHRLARRPADDGPRRPLSALPPATTFPTTPPSSSSATSSWTTCCAWSSSTSACIPSGAKPSRASDARAAADRRAPGRRRASGHHRLPEGGVARAGGDPPRLLPDAGARRRADRCEGREPVGQLPGRWCRSARPGSTPRWSTAGWPRR